MIIIKQPERIGVIKKSKEWPPKITIIGLPPAGGWVEFDSIIKNTPKPTAMGMMVDGDKSNSTTKNA